MSIRVDGDTKQAVTDLRFEGSSKIGTAGSGVTVLESGVLPTMVHKVRLSYTAFTGIASTSGSADLWTLPKGAIVERVICRVNEVFDGGAISDNDMTVGHSGDPDGFLATFDIDTAALLVGDVIADVGAGLVDATRADLATSSENFATRVVTATMTATGANLTALTTGQADIWILYKQLPGCE